MSIFGGNARVSKSLLDAAARIMKGEQPEEQIEENVAVDLVEAKKVQKLDPVGKEDDDVNNDGVEDDSDDYLKKRRKAVTKAVQADEETIHEGELPDLPKKKSMTSKDYSALANKHNDLASDHRKQAERHSGVNDGASNRHKEAAEWHDEAASAAKEASEDPSHSGMANNYAKSARGANHASSVARERGAEADKRRANVRKADGKDVDESVDVDAGNVEKALKHDCATHVHHEEHGVGRCIPGMHTLERVDEENGIVTHYDVMFENDEGPYIVENVPVAEMKVLKDMNHGHKKKKSMGEGYAGNYGSSVASYNREKDHEKRYEKENPGKKWKDLPWGHQQSHSAHYDKNPE
jgi:hypothetical protein